MAKRVGLVVKPAFLRYPFTDKSGFAWRGKGINYSPWKRQYNGREIPTITGFVRQRETGRRSVQN